jgi:CDP-4-dehydro-6-deoxyglucose reductase, E1
MGTVYDKTLLGNFGLASTFSFYVGHHMSTVEGGAVCTDDEELAIMLQLVRAHGWDRNMSQERQDKIRKLYKVNSTFYSRYTFYDLGFNLRPTEINGFIGNLQISYAQEIFDKRQENFLRFAEAIYAQTDRYYPIRFDHIDFVSNFAVPVVCKSVEIRDELVKRCAGKVEIRPIVGGDMTQQPFFQKHMPKFVKVLKKSNAQLAHRQGLYFGNNPELTKKEIKEMIALFTK